MKDILLIFILCAALIVAVGMHPHERKSDGGSVVHFGTPFASPLSGKSPAQGLDEKRKVDNDDTEVVRVFQRKFEWSDPAQNIRNTVFSIPEKSFKYEVKRFGTLGALRGGNFMKRKGFRIVSRRGFMQNSRIVEELVTVVDYRQIFERNLKYFPQLTHQLSLSADIPAAKDPLYTFLRFVQHIYYKLPPMRYKSRFINSFFVPLVCLYEQYGDCDSKSLLLSQFLCTTPEALKAEGEGEKVAMVLVRGNGLAHAVLAVKRTPLLGMTSLNDIQKGSYILLETTKPGWAPGFINPRVMDAIKAGFFLFVELN